jgi:hypothetical protein
VEQSPGSNVIYGEVKILMMLLDRVWITKNQYVMHFDGKKNVIDPFFSEDATVTGAIFLAMMENTTLPHVPVGTVFQSDGAPPNFSHCVCALMDGGVSITE